MSDAVALLLTASIRATGVLAGAWLVTLLLRRSSASARHMVWTCAIGALVLTPVVLQLPVWQVTIPDALARWMLSIDATPTDTEAWLVEATSVAGDAASNTPTPTPNATASDSPSPVTYVSAIWSAGFVVVMVHMLIGMAAASRLRRAATRATASWIDDARVLAESVGVAQVAFAESTRTPVPFVCGVVNALVVMPSTVQQWDAARRRVVLLHELAHVKRRDCLTHLLAQVVCAMYWFHPLSWFAAHRLRSEREQACDDFVLAAGGVRRSEYAHHLMAVAKQALPHPSLLASTGVAMAHRSQLEARLMSILDPTARRTAPPLARFGAVAFAVCALGVVSLRLQAQAPTRIPSVSGVTTDTVSTRRNNEVEERRKTIVRAESPIASGVPRSQSASPPAQPQAPPAGGRRILAPQPSPVFEAASIKRNTVSDFQLGFPRFQGNTFTARQAWVQLLVAVAYGVRAGDVTGPEWTAESSRETETFDIEAKFREGSSQQEQQAMLRQLLESRFALRVHRETRQLPGYVLTRLSDGDELGPNLRRSTADCALGQCSGRITRGLLTGRGTQWSTVLQSIAGGVGGRLIDRTGLSGAFDVELIFGPSLSAQPGDPAPDIFTAVRHQLGLKLESTRVPVEMLIIDSVERPTPN